MSRLDFIGYFKKYFWSTVCLRINVNLELHISIYALQSTLHLIFNNFNQTPKLIILHIEYFFQANLYIDQNDEKQYWVLENCLHNSHLSTSPNSKQKSLNVILILNPVEMYCSTDLCFCKKNTLY